MKFGLNLGAPLCALASLATAVDDWMGCDYRKFCTRHRDYMLKELTDDKLAQSFYIDQDSVKFSGGELSATLKRDNPLVTWWTADTLDFKMNLYQDGIARVMV